MCQKQTYLETFINIEDAQWDKRKGGGNLGKKTFPTEMELVEVDKRAHLLFHMNFKV